VVKAFLSEVLRSHFKTPKTKIYTAEAQRRREKMFVFQCFKIAFPLRLCGKRGFETASSLSVIDARLNHPHPGPLPSMERVTRKGRFYNSPRPLRERACSCS